jgi:hypothetical protein
MLATTILGTLHKVGKQMRDKINRPQANLIEYLCRQLCFSLILSTNEDVKSKLPSSYFVVGKINFV